MLRIAGLGLVVGASAFVGTAQAGVIITDIFDLGQAPPPGGPGPNAPLSPTDADGVHALGVTFGFTENGDPSSAAVYGDTILTDLNALLPLSDPVLDGPADGVLTLVFDAPTTFLSFDIAFTVPTAPGGQVTIGASSQLITTTGDVGDSQAFSIGSFSWTPSAAFTQATVTFDNAASSAWFAIDNLSYTPDPAPEPASIVFVGAGLILAAAVRKPRRLHPGCSLRINRKFWGR